MRYIAITLLLLAGMTKLNAQEVYSSSGRPVNDKRHTQQKKGFDASRIIFGGGLGFGFGNVTNISVSPIVGYRISDNFSAGVGLGYQYFRIKDKFTLQDQNLGYIKKPYTATMYSPSIWGRYVIWRNIFAHLEYEHNFMSETVYDPYVIYTGPEKAIKNRINVPSLLLGGGIRQPISERVSIIFQGLYDVLQDKNSPYLGTISFRFGIVAGF